jgi:hypothetical protein
MQADQGCDFDFMMGVGNDRAFVEGVPAVDGTDK